MRVLERDAVVGVAVSVAQRAERPASSSPRSRASSGEDCGRSFTQVGGRLAWPWSCVEALSGLVSGTWGTSYIWKNIAFMEWTSGMSRPSIQTTGVSVSLPWSCQVQLGVRTRSPGAMYTRSPSTAV